MGNVKVFFIPYAGASALAYYKWKNLFNRNVEPIFIELAGRGSRSGTNFYKNMDDGAEDISEIIASKINNDDYIIFGHSMGVILAFEAYYKLLEKNVRLPKHMFFSAKDAPHLIDPRERIHNYEDEKFLKAASLYGGLPDVFPDDEVKRIFLSVLKADFKLLGEYVYCAKPEKIKCNISVLFGENDFSTKLSEIEQWRVHAGKNFNAHIFKGDHFFINHAHQDIVKMISEAIQI